MSDETTTAIATTSDSAMVPADPMAIFHTMERIIQSTFVESLAMSGLYSERGDSHEVTKHKIVSKIAHGMELGLTPMASLSNVNIIKGKPTLGAIMIGSIVMRSNTMAYEVLESSDTVCRMRWVRDGVEVGINQWTMDDAKRAGLNGDNWRKYPVDMLRSRCITQGARTYCPDLFGGPIYVPDELKSEVVQVTQSGRMPGVEHPDITQRPDGRAQADYGKVRVEAQNRFIATCEKLTSSRDEQVRLWEAGLKKSNKNSKMMTAEDFDDADAIVRAMHAQGNLTEWCDTIHGPDPDVVGEAEVVEPVEDAEAKAWKSSNGLFHAVLGKFLTANKYEKQGREYTIIKDSVRSNCDLEAGAEWSEVTPEAMRQTVKVLEYDGGKAAIKGLSGNGEWAVSAASRGAI